MMAFRRVKIFIFCALLAADCFSQNTDPEKIKHQLQKSADDSGKASLLILLCKYYRSVNLDTAILLGHQAYELSKKSDYTKGEAESLNLLGEMFMEKDDYYFGLQTEINSLKIYEKLNDTKGEAQTYYSIGNIYERVEDYQEALNNFIRCRNLITSFNDSVLMLNCYSSLGYNYYKLDNQDSAEKYAQIAFEMARSNRPPTGRLPWAIALMGAVQDKLGNPAIAMAYYYDAIAKARSFNDQSLFPYVYQVMAELYKRTTLLDSAILYGERAFEISKKINFSKGVADASIFLANLYSDLDKNKAVAYYKLSEQLRDSVFSAQKINQVQNIAYNEELRQLELQKERIAEAKERKENIQYALITIGIIAFIILFLILSHSFIVNAKLVGFFGVVALLVVFEFVNLVVHPYVANLTNHSPVLMLGILVLVASVLVPAHHYLQKWINEKLVEKNKRIRLAAAKKIIETFEKETKPKPS